ncbi:hypothetical protein ABZP36_030543 [Zizania latifolia]
MPWKQANERWPRRQDARKTSFFTAARGCRRVLSSLWASVGLSLRRMAARGRQWWWIERFGRRITGGRWERRDRENANRWLTHPSHCFYQQCTKLAQTTFQHKDMNSI